MIYIAADHQGFELKEKIKKQHSDLKDLGPFKYDKDDDYPDFVKKMAENIKEGDLGILICSTGIGMSMAANRYGLRAALCCNTEAAQQAREHNNANVLCLGKDSDIEIIKVFLNSKFTGEERHVRRLNKISKIKNQRCK